MPMIDTSWPIATAEGISLSVSPAGPVPRAMAFLVDLAIRAAALWVIWLAVGSLGYFGAGVGLVSAFLMEWLYPTFFEVLRDGATPGKRMFGLRVIHDSGVPVGWYGSLVRNLLRVVDFLPFAYGFGLAAMLVHPAFKRLGDVAAGTLVVYAPGHVAAVATSSVAPLAPAFELTPEEERALVTFAERSARMSDARAAEITGVLAPLGEADVERLHRYAAWIQGNR